MGNEVLAFRFSYADQSTYVKPIVFCKADQEILNKAISISIPLSKELISYSTSTMRTMKMEACLLKVLEDCGDNPVIKDIDPMFNPSYQMDVMKILISVCKKKSFSVIWPGRYEDGKLYYAEEGYVDYKTYNLSDYDITVVI